MQTDYQGHPVKIGSGWGVKLTSLVPEDADPVGKDVTIVTKGGKRWIKTITGINYAPQGHRGVIRNMVVETN